MLFFEPQFAVLFLAFFSTYWLMSARTRPILIVITSYVFYGFWDWRFLGLILLSTVIDYVAALRIRALRGDKAAQTRWLMVSLGVNLGALGFFKYFDFFATSMASLMGVDPDGILLNVILPAGISFYTFQTLSYTIDVWRGDAEPETDFFTFAAFVAFFPQLIAGPIERAGTLLGQLKATPKFLPENLYLGARLFLFGLFKKLVIADTMGDFVDPVFADPAAHDPLTLIFAAWCFSLQIYCDFSGYTDMARGLAKTIGINLSINFNTPYLATSIRDFWQRWHITLYSWLADYVYRPLGGSRGRLVTTLRNIMIVFVLSGLWHGAGWNFILWGAFHGVLICGERLLAPTAVGRTAGRLPSILKMFIVFNLVSFAWILFRAPDMATFSAYMQGIAAIGQIDGWLGWESFALSYGIYHFPTLGGHPQAFLYAAVFLAFALPLFTQQAFRKDRVTAVFEQAWPRDLRVALLVAIAIGIWLFRADASGQFLYSQF